MSGVAVEVLSTPVLDGVAGCELYEKRLPRVKLEDDTLGIPADALDSFQTYSV